ncbi:MAG TPA: hypothetical protein VNF03_09225 [Patescibacteria group bacterium]|nr:hypothetical protein [Patescibacteria group bacterium]
MKAKKSNRKTRSSGKRAVKDLRARKDQGAKGGARSDLLEKSRFQLNEVNKVTDPAPRLVHETTHQK